MTCARIGQFFLGRGPSFEKFRGESVMAKVAFMSKIPQIAINDLEVEAMI